MPSDRTWPLPDRPHAMRMSWHDLLFAHWPVEPALLHEHMPPQVRVDTFEDQAWIAVVPFRMSDVSPRGIPAIPGLAAFPELNVRTYVTINGKPGVWFFSLDATQRIAVRVARKFFHLKYMDAKMSLTRQGGWFQYSSIRTHRGEVGARFTGKYRPTNEVFMAESGTFEYWSTARYCLYTIDDNKQILRGEIDHQPWPLQRAELQVVENTMLDWLWMDTDQTPRLLFSKGVAVKAWSNEKCVVD